MLVLTKYIARHEFKPLERYISLVDVLDGARKVVKGLAIETKPPRALSQHRFFKVRIGPKNRARMIVFMVTGNRKVVPVLIRLKADKVLGANMAMNNAEVVAQVNQNLDRVIADIESGDFQEFSF